MEELANNYHLFKWGKKRGTSIKKDTQFYESFVLGGVHYSLFDNVYLFKDGDVTPYIGKILRLWEKDDGGKKVKVLWFFLPSEISTYTGDYKPLENELFLASGDGRGLTNINDLGAISGKCSVICTSKDKRNRQPSKDELEKSDFFFCQTFDVKNHVISDIFPDEIAQTKIESLLNKEVDPGLSEKAEGGPSERSLQQEASKKTSVENKETNGVPRSSASNKEKDGIKNDGQCVPEKVTFARHKAEAVLCNDKKVTTTATQFVDKVFSAAKRKEEAELCSDRPYKKLKISTPAESRIIEVTRKPDIERSKWFKGPSWEERIPKANEKGTLMLLLYFDQSLTSGSIEDIMYSAFRHNCSARVLPVIPSYRNPHYGNAYVIFKTPEVTIDTIEKINSGCLMLQDGSSFLASKGMLQLPPKGTKFPGHMTVDSRKAYREEMRNAVSTSHCSQPNTIEYEMSMEWILLQEKTAICFERLHRRHGVELKKLKSNLKAIEE